MAYKNKEDKKAYDQTYMPKWRKKNLKHYQKYQRDYQRKRRLAAAKKVKRLEAQVKKLKEGVTK